MRTPWMSLLALAPLVACSVGGFHAQVVSGTCKGSAISFPAATDTGGSWDTGDPDDTGYDPEPEVEAEVSGTTLVLHLLNLDANCCPSPAAEVLGEGTELKVLFDDVTSSEACDCRCFTDFDVEVPDLNSGTTYEVTVEYHGEVLDILEVDIP